LIAAGGARQDDRGERELSREATPSRAHAAPLIGG